MNIRKLLLCLALAVALALCAAAQASSQSIDELQAQIDALQAQLDALKEGDGDSQESADTPEEDVPILYFLEQNTQGNGEGGTLMNGYDSYIFRLDDETGGHVPGNPSLARSEIVRIEFRDSLAGAGSDAWDMSEAGDSSVLGWTERADGGLGLVIAADGPVRANAVSNYFFGSYTGVREIKFNGCFDCSGATSMHGMFEGCVALESLDLEQMDTSKVKDMSNMFWSCEKLRYLDLSALDTSKVEDMSYMFYSCDSLEEIYPDQMDTGAVTDMSSMFDDCDSLVAIDLQGLNTSNVTDMSDLFFSCNALQFIHMGGLDTSRVEDMSGMFQFCYDLRQVDVSGFDTTSVTNMASMFCGDGKLQELGLESFDFARVTKASEMFKDCTGLRDIWFGDDFILDIECDAKGIFTNCDATVHSPYDEDAVERASSVSAASTGSRVLNNGDENLDFLPNNPSVRRSEITSISFFDSLDRVPNSGAWDASLEQDGSVLAWIERYGSIAELMFAAEGGVRGGESCSGTFYGYSNLRSIFFNGCFDTTGTRYMDNMFAWCSSLVEIDLTGLDTSQVVDMSYMFYNCSSLEVVTAEDINTRSVVDMQAMFMDCTNLISLRFGEDFVVDCRAPAMLDGTQFEGMDLF